MFSPRNTDSSHASKNDNDTFFKSRLQTKLAVGKPGDRYEQEADSTADKVVSKLKSSGEATSAQPSFFSAKPAIQQKKQETVQQKENEGQQEEEIQQKPLSESITPIVQTSLLEEPQAVQAKCADCEAREKASEKEGTVPVQMKCDKCAEKEEAQTIQRKGGGIELPVVPDALGEQEDKTKDPAKKPVEGETKPPAEGGPKGGKENGGVNLPIIASEKPETAEPELEPIQQKSNGESSGTTGIEQSLSASKGKGSTMSSDTQSQMNQGFGSDFGNVRIHTDSNAVQMNKELGSHAFTNGSDIYFNEGKYNPDSDSGKHLLAHELTHTVQQGASTNSVQRFTAPAKTVTPEPSPEKPNDGDVMEGKANSRYENDENVQNQDDLDEDDAKEKKDPPRDEIRSENSQVKSEGVTAPPVDRGGQAAEKISTQKTQMNEKLAEPPAKGDKKAEEKDAKKAKAPASAEEGQAKAAQAEAAANAVEIPVTPQPFKHPNVVAPVDSVGEALPRQANIDTQVRGLGYIGEMLRIKGYELKEAAAEKTSHAFGLDAVVGKLMEDLANALEGTQKIDDHNTSRKDVSKTSKDVLDDSKQRQSFVAAEAPGLAGEAEGGKADSGGLASEASSKASQAESETPEDEDAQADAAQQNADMNQTATGAKSMDDAVNQTGERAKQYIADAEAASKDNQQSEGQIQETDAIIAQVDTRVAEMKAKNEESNTKIQGVQAGPTVMRQEAARTAQTGDELIAATIYMEAELNSLQDEYLASMKSIESREKAEERIKKEQEQKPQPDLTPEDQQLFALAAMPEQEQQATIQQLTPVERDGLLGALDKMSKQMPDNGTDETEGARKEVKLGSLVPEGPQDPRQEQITAVDNQRVSRLSGVLDVADVNMNYLSEEQQMMLAEKLVAESLTDDVKNISILQIGKGMIEGMLDPRMALQGVVDGFGKTLTGVANLFNAEAWAKDPLGNLLQVGADISTGMAQIFSAILGVAGMITALMVAIIIISWGFATPVCGPVIGWMGTVMTYAGWGAIIAGSLSVLFNSLAYIKNLNDAGTAASARELFGNTEQMKQNATDGLTGAMSIVEGVGAVKMGPVMKSGNFISNIPKSPGAFFKNSLEGAKDGLGAIKNIPGNVVKGAKKLFSSGKKGLMELKDKIKKFFRGGAPDVNTPHGTAPHTKTPEVNAPHANVPETPTAKKHNQELLDDANTKNLDDLTPEQRRLEINETSKGTPKEIKPDSPYYKTHDIEIEANGHTYRRRKDGNGWCRFSDQKCGIPEAELPPNVKKQVETIDSNNQKPKTEGADSNSATTSEKEPPKADSDGPKTETVETKAPETPKTSQQKKLEAEIDAALKKGDITPEQAEMMRKYNDNVKKGTLSVDDMKAEMKKGKEFDPETNRFGDPDGGKKTVVDDATRDSVKKGVKGDGADLTNDPNHKVSPEQKKQIQENINTAEGEIDKLNDPANTSQEAIDYRKAKEKSFEKHQPESVAKADHAKEYDDLNKGRDHNDPAYQKERSDDFNAQREMQKTKHSTEYDRGQKNNKKGEAFEKTRTEQMGEGTTRRTTDDKIEIDMNGKPKNVSPDLETPDGYRETKSGYISKTPEVEDQILRYSKLMQENPGKKVIYELFDGASKDVKQMLKEYGISYIDYTQI